MSKNSDLRFLRCVAIVVVEDSTTSLSPPRLSRRPSEKPIFIAAFSKYFNHELRYCDTSSSDQNQPRRFWGNLRTRLSVIFSTTLTNAPKRRLQRHLRCTD